MLIFKNRTVSYLYVYIYIYVCTLCMRKKYNIYISSSTLGPAFWSLHHNWKANLLCSFACFFSTGHHGLVEHILATALICFATYLVSWRQKDTTQGHTVTPMARASGIVPSSVSSQVKPSPLQGMDGTLAVCAKMLAAILSPRAAITPAKACRWM